MNSRKVTIKDIARHLNISTATVSRAMRDMHDIHPDTRKAVLDLAREWDYQPNQMALNLVKSKTKTLGVIVPNLNYYFFSEVLSCIEDAAHAEGYSVLIGQSKESFEREKTNVKDLTHGRVDGVIISLSRETSDVDHLQRLLERGIPIVFFDRHSDQIEASKVIVDNREAARNGVCHLIDNNYKKIAYLAGPRNLLISNQRLLGYKDALVESGLDFRDQYVLHNDYLSATTQANINILLQLAEPPDAILCVSDRIAFTAIHFIKKSGLTVPDDIGVVSFNDDPMCGLFTPSVTSIAQPIEEFGKQIVQQMMRQIKLQQMGEVLPAETIVLPTELKVRESSVRASNTF
jgi:DNA-binding LacI/PurR family transcriptional regulator